MFWLDLNPPSAYAMISLGLRTKTNQLFFFCAFWLIQCIQIIDILVTLEKSLDHLFRAQWVVHQLPAQF